MENGSICKCPKLVCLYSHQSLSYFITVSSTYPDSLEAYLRHPTACHERWIHLSAPLPPGRCEVSRWFSLSSQTETVEPGSHELNPQKLWAPNSSPLKLFISIFLLVCFVFNRARAVISTTSEHLMPYQRTSSVMVDNQKVWGTKERRENLKNSLLERFWGKGRMTTQA